MWHYFLVLMFPGLYSLLSFAKADGTAALPDNRLSSVQMNLSVRPRQKGPDGALGEAVCSRVSVMHGEGIRWFENKAGQG